MIIKIAASITLISVLLAGAVAGGLAFFQPLRPKWPLFFLFAFLIAEAVLLYGVFERRAPVFGKIFWRGPRDLPEIALTFDDGPNEPFTSKILDILKERGVGATFFVLGQNAEKYPETLKRIAAEGHEIGNHTWSHEVLPLKLPGEIGEEIERTGSVIEKASGVRPRFFRAPHGWRNPWVDRTVRAKGLIPVAWTLGVWDTDRPGAALIAQRTIEGAENGCVLLLHDGRGTEDRADSSQLAEALPAIVDSLRGRGYRFVSLSRMMEPRKR